ncbi:plasmid replication initiator protein [Gordonia hongkongensis]|uniref:Plasmid replication initiator protein n=2 Tax=Gordonia TaxID=2053 RepID=A0AAX3TB23_9ACTN|nr:MULTISPECIES: replication initiator [Gordonia]PZT92644.1 MAG: plasmid replication initiator protein [Gordonia sp. (in: high G+C Gram-positive bacteria)]QIK48630.1 plasmid replication initiator protein [Gordonia terrae]MBN0971287.1 plasmid replication initiator protein [Gordonia sp. BP-119]MBN0983652.1 plasmid replication initiator protein [Gordonia sp. BP-94]MDF6100012.1 plasmid replication initiator protein [Gordonia hongkongensis]
MSSNPPPTLLPTPAADLDAATVREMLRRAGGQHYPRWAARVRATGYCLHPIHLQRRHGVVAADRLSMRCGNRRAAVCISCSRLYAGDTWQLVHAGILGGHHNIPDTVTQHPQVFLTLTAPSFGAVYPTAHRTHAGQPRRPDTYDYRGHVLFTWWAPSLWQRFTMRLRRLLAAQLKALGLAKDAVRLSFLKVHENQTRLIPHYHAVVRLDHPDTTGKQCGAIDFPVSSSDLAALAAEAVRSIVLPVPDTSMPDGVRELRFGPQIDARPLDASIPERQRRKIAGYLAKYVTKSVTDAGISPRPISPAAIDDPTIAVQVSRHVLQIWHTLRDLADQQPDEYAAMVRWLHTLGYRGHVTTKSRHYSTTLGHLRQIRAVWRQQHGTADNADGHGDNQGESDCEPWEFAGAGHFTHGDYQLTLAAAHRHMEQLWARREHAWPAGGPP